LYFSSIIERESFQAGESLKTAIEVVKSAGLFAGPPTFRGFDVAVDYSREGSVFVHFFSVLLFPFLLHPFL
jgi:hypothetical protein